MRCLLGICGAAPVVVPLLELLLMQIVEAANYFTVDDESPRGVVEEGREETIRVMRVSSHYLLVERGGHLLCRGRLGLRLRNSGGEQAFNRSALMFCIVASPQSSVSEAS